MQNRSPDAQGEDSCCLLGRWGRCGVPPGGTRRVRCHERAAAAANWRDAAAAE
jgi:hypothetical protein